MTRNFRRMSLGLLALLAVNTTATAQVTEEERQFMNRIVEASNNVGTDNAKEAYGQCVALSKELAGKTGIDDLQKLYFEAELESCFAYAMNNGKFSDETGDACSHHMSFATKLAEVIRRGNGTFGFVGELVKSFGDRLERATEIGPQLGCKGDYAAFAPAIAMAREAGAMPTPEPDLTLLEEIGTASSQITPENAKDMQKTCEAVLPKIAAKPGRPEAERLYLEGHAAGCVSFAMERGKYSDASGDACSHLFTSASKLAAAYRASQNDPLYAGFTDVFKMETEGAIGFGAELKCTQDFKGLLTQ